MFRKNPSTLAHTSLHSLNVCTRAMQLWERLVLWPTISNGALTQLAISRAPPWLPAEALAARMEFPPSFFRHKNTLGHTQYIHTATLIVEKLPPLLSIQALHLCNSQLQWPCSVTAPSSHPVQDLQPKALLLQLLYLTLVSTLLTRTLHMPKPLQTFLEFHRF